MIGCTNDAMGKVTKKLQDAGYDISYLTDDFTAVNITKTEKDKDRIQFCAYLERRLLLLFHILSYLPIIVISIKRLLVLSMSTKMMIILLVKVPKRKLKNIKKLDLSIDDLSKLCPSSP